MHLALLCWLYFFPEIGDGQKTATYIPYTAKFLKGKTFVVVHKTHYSLQNFHGASGPCHYVLYTANDSRGKLSGLAKKPQKFSPSKVLPYTVSFS